MSNDYVLNVRPEQRAAVLGEVSGKPRKVGELLGRWILDEAADFALSAQPAFSSPPIVGKRGIVRLLPAAADEMRYRADVSGFTVTELTRMAVQRTRDVGYLDMTRFRHVVSGSFGAGEGKPINYRVTDDDWKYLSGFVDGEVYIPATLRCSIEDFLEFVSLDELMENPRRRLQSYLRFTLADSPNVALQLLADYRRTEIRPLLRDIIDGRTLEQQLLAAAKGDLHVGSRQLEIANADIVFQTFAATAELFGVPKSVAAREVVASRSDLELLDPMVPLSNGERAKYSFDAESFTRLQRAAVASAKRRNIRRKEPAGILRRVFAEDLLARGLLTPSGSTYVPTYGIPNGVTSLSAPTLAL